MSEVVYLKDILKKEFMDISADNITLLKKSLGIPLTGGGVLVDITLDICDVTITAEALIIMNEWMHDFGITVIDSKESYRDSIFRGNKQIYEAERYSLSLEDFFIDGKFTEESLSNLHKTVQKIYTEIRNKVPLAVNVIKPVTNDVARGIAIYLLRMNKVITVNNIISTFGEKQLLPYMGQLLHDCKSNRNYWQSVREKYPIGSSMYVWFQEEGILRCKVESMEQMHINLVIESTDESVILRYGDLIDRYVFVFPVSLFEPVADFDGFTIYEDSELEPRKIFDPNKSKSLMEVTGTNVSDINFPELYREMQREEWRKMGFEPPEEIDLHAIMRGSKSPYDKLFS